MVRFSIWYSHCRVFTYKIEFNYFRFATVPLIAQALAASKISPSGPVGNFSFIATFISFRTDSFRETQYFGADPTPPRNGLQ
jgi:hypothetical protein